MGKKTTNEKPLKIEVSFEEAMKILINKAEPLPINKLMKKRVIKPKKKD